MTCLVHRALAVFQNKPVFLIDHIFSTVFKPQTPNTIMRNLKVRPETITDQLKRQVEPKSVSELFKIIAYAQMSRIQEALKELDSIVEMSLFDNDNDDETYGRVFQYTVRPSLIEMLQ